MYCVEVAPAMYALPRASTAMAFTAEMLAGRKVTYRNWLPSALSFATKVGVELLVTVELLVGIAEFAVVGNEFPVLPAT
jgi:hypothetical protein